MNYETHHELVTLLGEDAIEAVYNVVGTQRISFAALHQQVRRKKILGLINEGASFSAIAQQMSISRMTVYRVFHAEMKVREELLSQNRQ